MKPYFLGPSGNPCQSRQSWPEAQGHQLLDASVDSLPLEDMLQELLRGCSVSSALSSCHFSLSSTQQGPLMSFCSVVFPANLVVPLCCLSTWILPESLPISCPDSSYFVYLVLSLCFPCRDFDSYPDLEQNPSLPCTQISSTQKNLAGVSIQSRQFLHSKGNYVQNKKATYKVGEDIHQQYIQ